MNIAISINNGRCTVLKIDFENRNAKMLRLARIFEETEDETMCRFRSMTFPQFFKDFGKKWHK